MGRFVEVCRGKSMKVNASKSKMMVLGGEKGLECEVCVDGIHIEHVSKFKYLEYVLNESGTDETECSKKVASGRRVTGTIRSLVNVRSLQLEYSRVLRMIVRQLYGRRGRGLGLGLY